MDHFTSLIHRAADAATAAAQACRAWENGGDSDQVSDTAWKADGATAELLEAVACIDPTLAFDTYPETRLGRLALAGRLLVLAGTDEGGHGDELELGARALRLAAEA